MTADNPPVVRWIAEGEHAGVYIYVPAFGGRWRRTTVVPGGVEDRTVKHLPPGTEPLVTLRDVELAIDAYRETRDDIVESARASGELDDLAPSAVHEQARTDVLTELIDAADMRYE